MIPQARLLSLLRLLLLALGIGVLTFFATTRGSAAAEALRSASWLLVGACVAAAALVASVRLVRQTWQLALHLVMDLLWIGLLLFYTGGVASPGVILLFAVVLFANLCLTGGAARFLFPALAGMVLAGVAAIYLSGHAPFPQEWASANPQVFSAPRILGDLAVQVLALFLVDLLGGLLMGRLHEHRLFAGEVLDQLGEGVLAVDRHGHVAYVNAEAVRLLGLSDVPQAGVSASAALADQGLAEVRALLASARLPVLERWRGPAGRHLVLRVTQLTGRRGQEIGRSLLIADETRLATLEASARRAEGLAALGEMAAGIAHEIRNPLTSLRGCAQELAEVAVRSQRTEDAQLAQLIVSESDRLGRIVSDFLQMSRMRPPLRSDIELAPVIDGVRSLCAAHGDGPALSVQVAQELPRVHADAEQVRQVLLNLVNNARDAVGGVADPRIELRVAEAGEDNPLPGEAVMLQVVDNGPGMAPELLERVFTPFFSTKPQGTGLGLSLVSRIVREHEGVLRLDSTPGKGTVATIYLPTSSQTRAFKRALGGGG